MIDWIERDATSVDVLLVIPIRLVSWCGVLMSEQGGGGSRTVSANLEPDHRMNHGPSDRTYRFTAFINPFILNVCSLI